MVFIQILILLTWHSAGDGDANISKNDIYDIAGVVPDKWIDNLLEVCYDKNKTFEHLESFVNDITCEGFSGAQFINQLHDRIVNSDEMTDLQKSVISEKIAICSARLLEGANEYLQLIDLSSTIMKEIAANAA